MKKTVLLTILGLALVGPRTQAREQIWNTVDDQLPGTVWDISFAPDGTGYLVVVASTNNSNVSFVRRSRDAGVTWQDTSGLIDFHFQHVSVASNGDIYLGGGSHPPEGYRWAVWKSSDQGEHWVEVGNFPVGISAQLNDMAIDSSGAVYLVGLAGDTSNRWMVRKGVGGASGSWTWTTISNPPLADSIFSEATCVAVKARRSQSEQEEIYVGGSYSFSTQFGPVSNWLIRRSVDGGDTWIDVDRLDADSVVRNLSIAPDGSVLAVGSILATTGGGIVRQGALEASAPNGMVWTERARVSSFNPAAVGVDPSGRVFAGGAVSLGWQILASDTGEGIYRMVDSLTSGRVYCIAVDRAGDVFAGGRYNPTGNRTLAVVRKLVSSSPTLSISLVGSEAKVSWPTNATGFVLQAATTLANGGDWENSLATPISANGRATVTVDIISTEAFFRLRKP